MAPAAILSSAARALRLGQPLGRPGCLLARRAAEGPTPTPTVTPSPRLLSSSSVPTERQRCSDTRPRDSKELKRHAIEKTEDIYQRLSMKMDMISDGLDEQACLLKQLEVRMKENNKRGGVIDLTPWVVGMPASFLLFFLYNYLQELPMTEGDLS